MEAEPGVVAGVVSAALVDPATNAPTVFTGAAIRGHIRDERTAALLDLYCGLPKTDGVPHRCLANPRRLRRWLGNLMILEPVDGGEDFSYRLYGTAIAEAAGFDMTGRRVSAFASKTGAFFLSVYRNCLASDAPCLTQNLAEHAKRFVVWERLVLPFATATGGRHMVVSNFPIPVSWSDKGA